MVLQRRNVRNRRNLILYVSFLQGNGSIVSSFYPILSSKDTKPLPFLPISLTISSFLLSALFIPTFSWRTGYCKKSPYLGEWNFGVPTNQLFTVFDEKNVLPKKSSTVETLHLNLVLFSSTATFFCFLFQPD